MEACIQQKPVHFEIFDYLNLKELLMLQRCTKSLKVAVENYITVRLLQKEAVIPTTALALRDRIIKLYLQNPMTTPKTVFWSVSLLFDRVNATCNAFIPIDGSPLLPCEARIRFSVYKGLKSVDSDHFSYPFYGIIGLATLQVTKAQMLFTTKNISHKRLDLYVELLISKLFNAAIFELSECKTKSLF